MTIRTRRHSLFVHVATAAMIAAIVATGASAASLTPMTLEEVARASEDVVHGTVTATRSYWNADRTMILTEVRVAVHASLTGDSEEELLLTHPGGVVGAIRVELPGIPAFQAGNEAVLFVTPEEAGHRRVTGLVHGRFDVDVEETTGAKRVRVPAVVDTRPEGERRAEATKTPQTENAEDTHEVLGAFFERVQALMARTRKK